MKTNKLVLIGILIIAFAAMVAPVLAGTTGTAYVSGNPSKYVAITLSSGTVPLTLIPNAAATSSALTITADSNSKFTITVNDNTGRALGDGTQGYMGNYSVTNSAYEVIPNNTKLASPLQLSGTTTGTTTVGTITPPILAATPQTLYTGTHWVASQSLPTLFTQPVAYNDPFLLGTNVYRMDMMFTITAV